MLTHVYIHTRSQALVAKPKLQHPNFKRVPTLPLTCCYTVQRGAASISPRAQLASLNSATRAVQLSFTHITGITGTTEPYGQSGSTVLTASVPRVFVCFPKRKHIQFSALQICLKLKLTAPHGRLCNRLSPLFQRQGCLLSIRHIYS